MENSDEQPVREVTISAFKSGKYEVTNELYGIYMGQTGYRAPGSWEDEKFGKTQPKNPVVTVSHDDATVFADWQKRRLLTEAEGEYAARGPEGLKYPWGNKLDLSRVTFNTDRTSPVDAHPDGASPFGVMDLSGNVWEWRGDDWYGAYDPKDLIDPKGPKTGTSRVLRGGSWNSNDSDYLRGANRINDRPEGHYDDVGFRVAGD
jgi:formylglycine-generating enzyme required for sulfatase activity